MVGIQAESLELNKMLEKRGVLGIDFLDPEVQRQGQKTQGALTHGASRGQVLDQDVP